jgi:hypothetical protein
MIFKNKNSKNIINTAIIIYFKCSTEKIYLIFEKNDIILLMKKS